MRDGLRQNRLIYEKSPYLLQHAKNPVDWYPWGDKAFDLAKEQDKLIFLSIGYSTCHWCHVMERESFENDEVAEILNASFVAVKVDREEHPDVDDLYMHACQMMTGSGGWPLTIVITPDKHPVFAATYLPPDNSRMGRGLKNILSVLASAWREEKGNLMDIGAKVISSLESHTSQWERPKGLLEKAPRDSSVFLDLAHEGFKQFEESYDPKFGGFFGAPKFPMPGNLIFLLGYHSLTRNRHALAMVENTLKGIYKGGIYDHIGFGVCRYSTDEKWLIPHFEKILTDNALLSFVAFETYKVTGDEFYLTFGIEILDYVVRVLKNPEGGFYTGEDADSEGEEGKFYAWTLSEVAAVLGDAGKVMASNYDITENGNFSGKNIPNLISKHISLKMNEETRTALQDHRESRVHPFRDEKVLVGPNGLIIVSLLRAYGITKDTAYLDLAESGLDFIVKHCVFENQLYTGYRNGLLNGFATLDDYAYLLWASVEMYLHTLDPDYLRMSDEFAEQILEQFYDSEKGGFFLSGIKESHLPVRRKTVYDGALPSGNAVVTYVFQKLARLTKNPYHAEISARQTHVFLDVISENPVNFAFWLLAFLYSANGGTDVVITGPEPDAFHRHLMARYLPFGTWAYADNIAALYDEYDNYIKETDSTVAYVCKGKMCKPAVSKADEMEL